MFLTWQSVDLHDIKALKKFYVKRLIGILPLYYFVALIYVLFLGQESTFQNILIAPIELLVIQSNFHSLFLVTHNGGTWFVSCILMCYLAYPMIQEIIKQISTKARKTILIVAGFILLYSPFVVYFFQTSQIYSNPFFRILEFLIGSILCSLLTVMKSHFPKAIFSWYAIAIEYAVLIIGVTIAVQHNFFVGDYMLYSLIALPVFIIQIVSMAGVEFPQWMQKSRVVRYICDLSYSFFLAQFFTWKTTLFIIAIMGTDTSFLRIICSFLLCVGYTVLLHESIEVPISKTLKRRLL